MVLSMATYTGSVEAIADEVAEFTEERAQARVRARENVHEWLAQKELKHRAASCSKQYHDNACVDRAVDCACIHSSMSASVWRIKCQVGQIIKSADGVMIVLKAMKLKSTFLRGRKMLERWSKEWGMQAGDPLVWVS